VYPLFVVSSSVRRHSLLYAFSGVLKPFATVLTTLFSIAVGVMSVNIIAWWDATDNFYWPFSGGALGISAVTLITTIMMCDRTYGIVGSTTDLTSHIGFSVAAAVRGHVAHTTLPRSYGYVSLFSLRRPHTDHE
jgi:hypothetical protein